MGERREVEQREVEGLRKEVFPFGTSLFSALAEEILNTIMISANAPGGALARTIIILAVLFTSFF
jgi:hypothetical protein